MEVHVYKVLFKLIVLLIGFGHTTANIETKEMCRYRGGGTCHSSITCGTGTLINITKVEYRDKWKWCISTNCGLCCYTGLQISTEHKESIMKLCNDQPTCNLELWNSNKNWKMKITYTCNESPTVTPSTTTATTSSPRTETTDSSIPRIETTDSSSPHIETTDSCSQQTETTESSSPQIETTESSSPPIETTDYSSSTAVQSSPHSPEQSNGSSRIVRTKDGESADFPLGAAIAIPVGIVVMILVIVVVVWFIRRRSNGTSNGKQKEGNTLPMQGLTDNNRDNAQPFGIREDLQEAHEQEYVETTSNKGTLNITCDTVDQGYVDTNQGGINTTDDDEYNMLNTHQAPLQIDPNYDHLPKDSHTTVDETYSHVTDSQTTVPDATYSHLQNSKSNASHNGQSNQDNSNNVYNHMNTLSEEDNVYNNIQTKFTQNNTSNLTETRTEDDYDHTDWNQAKSSNPIASTNGAIKTFDTTNLAEHADDEYAVVNKKTDQAASNGGNNYFVLEKQSY